MILKIGGVAHPARKAWIAVSKRERLSKINRRMWYDTVIDCGGTLLQADGDNAALSSQMQAWEAVCSGSKDIVLYRENGTTPTHHRYLNADTIEGIRLDRFAWLKGNPSIRDAYGSGTENFIKRSWQARFVAKFRSDEHAIIDWYEWIEVIGDGGPIFVAKPAITGPVQFQQTQAFSSVKLIQGGHATGLYSPPPIPDAIFPAAVHREKTRLLQFTPTYAPIRNYGYGKRWTFFMEYATAVSASPTPLVV